MLFALANGTVGAIRERITDRNQFDISTAGVHRLGRSAGSPTAATDQADPDRITAGHVGRSAGKCRGSQNADGGGRGDDLSTGLDEFATAGFVGILLHVETPE
jgi:hypothetical protein